MTSILALPSTTIPPIGFKLSPTARRARRRIARREFLQLTTRGGLATGLAFAAMMPTARRAGATHDTPPPEYPTSPGCYGPTRTGQNLAGSTGCCSCGSTVRSMYCNGDGWHRSRHPVSGPSWERFYRLRRSSCKGVDDNGNRVQQGHNSWLWTIAGTSQTWRCSDGEVKFCWSGWCGAWEKTVCPKRQ